MIRYTHDARRLRRRERYTGAMQKKDALTIVGVVIIAIVIGTSVFVSDNGSVQNTFTRSAVVVPFTRVIQGTQSAVTSRVNYLIKSKNELDELWKMIRATGKPPAVDFKTNMVAAVFVGGNTKNNPTIAVEKIEDANVRTVSIKLDYCAKNNKTNYEIIAMPTTSLHLTHEDKVIKTDCQS